MANGWYTTSELEQTHGISKRLAYTWFKLLEGQGLARRAHGGKHGVLLFNTDGSWYLRCRAKQPGKPNQKLDAEEACWLIEALREGKTAEQIAIHLGTTVATAQRWIDNPPSLPKEGEGEACSCSQ